MRKALDLFCGAGGASAGLAAAGFDVTGVDRAPQPRYPFRFVQADVLTFDLSGYDLIWASPPCQAYSTQTAQRDRHPRYIAIVRELLQATGTPYVIENVEGARTALIDPLKLCGSSFGLDLRRHRYFECSFPVPSKPCDHAWQTPRFRSLDMSMVRAGRLACVVGVHGHLNYPGERELRQRAMGIDWMNDKELAQAIPPAYSQYIARAL